MLCSSLMQVLIPNVLIERIDAYAKAHSLMTRSKAAQELIARAIDSLESEEDKKAAETYFKHEEKIKQISNGERL